MATWPWNLRSLFKFGNSAETSQDASNKLFDHIYSPLIDDKKEEIRIRTHSVRSHGMIVARSHMYDWLTVMVLAVIMIFLDHIHPFYRFVGKDMMTDLKYPFSDNTVPMWAVHVISVLLPMTVFMGFYLNRRDVYDLHHAILGLLFSVFLTGVITDAIKDAVGRPRPDFFWRCFPDGKDFYDRLGNVICHGDSDVIREGHKSFPSGHTSWCFSGLGFLSLYLSGKIRCFDRKGHVAKLCVMFLPLVVACLVGISRVDDYWHHWQDVFAGALIGMTMATFCYLQFFAPPYHAEGWGPYAFFRALEASRLNAQESGPFVDQTNVISEVQVTESSLDNFGLILDDPESGIRVDL